MHHNRSSTSIISDPNLQFISQKPIKYLRINVLSVSFLVLLKFPIICQRTLMIFREFNEDKFNCCKHDLRHFGDDFFMISGCWFFLRWLQSDRFVMSTFLNATNVDQFNRKIRRFNCLWIVFKGLVLLSMPRVVFGFFFWAANPFWF